MTQPVTRLSCTYYIPEGGKIRVEVNNYDENAQARDFRLNEAMIQRII